MAHISYIEKQELILKSKINAIEEIIEELKTIAKNLPEFYASQIFAKSKKLTDKYIAELNALYEQAKIF